MKGMNYPYFAIECDFQSCGAIFNSNTSVEKLFKRFLPCNITQKHFSKWIKL